MGIRYIYQKTVVGWNWHPVIDDEVLFYPHGTLKDVRKFVNIYIDEIQNYLASEDNYGLSFYICGYDVNAQNYLRDDWAELGVSVF